MKKIVFLLLLLASIPSIMKSQAHLGATSREIQIMHPDKVFKTSYVEGVKIIGTDMDYGNFVYVFNNQGVSVLCMQFPYNLGCLNQQIEIYNNTYVILSKSSWKAYLKGGGIMTIKLIYTPGQNGEEGYYRFDYIPE